VIAEVAPDKLSQAILLTENSPLSFSDALKKTIGVSYLEATYLILNNWELPSLLLEAFDRNNKESNYKKLLENATSIRQKINLKTQPFEYMSENHEPSELEKEIVMQSYLYHEMCLLYCR
jgi:hypothetical protein